MGDRRGGPRERVERAPVGQRTDLNTQPVRAAPGQPFGERARQERAQRTIPLPQLPGPPRPGPAGLPSARPGERLFTRPTERPDEPVTAGMSVGPGGGPEILGETMAMRINNPMLPDVIALRPWLPFLEFRASQSDSTESFRNFVRRVRAAMPPV